MPASSEPRPHWNRRTLLFRGRVLKQFGRPAPNAELLLQAFEEQNWSRSIDDPLPPVRGRNQKRRLHETIQNLNRRLSLRLIIFRGDGCGKGVRWDPA